MELTKEYNPETNPRYDNYDAIEVSKTRDIPKDYYGVMGVPLSYLNYHCPEQFEILELAAPIINGKHLFKRILIKRR